MRNASTVLAATAVLMSGFTPGPSPSEAAPHTNPPVAPGTVVTRVASKATPQQDQARFQVHDDSPQLVNLAEWARDRYLDAGMTLPSVDVYFHENRDRCDGNQGRAITQEDGYHLDVCSTEATTLTRKLVLHELAHTWVEDNLTETQRQAFMDLRNVTVWNDHGAQWWHRGTEHAAEILAWGLQETSRRPRLLADNDLDSLTTAFIWLTGTRPLCDTTHERPPTEKVAAQPQSALLHSATKTAKGSSSRLQPDRLEP